MYLIILMCVCMCVGASVCMYRSELIDYGKFVCVCLCVHSHVCGDCCTMNTKNPEIDTGFKLKIREAKQPSH